MTVGRKHAGRYEKKYDKVELDKGVNVKIVLFFIALCILIFGLACSRSKKKDYSEIINLFEAHTYTTPEIDNSLLYRLYIPSQQPEKQKLPLSSSI